MLGVSTEQSLLSASGLVALGVKLEFKILQLNRNSKLNTTINNIRALNSYRRHAIAVDSL